jgi:hypothetical protein
VTRDEAAAILGSLSGDPASQKDGCTYPVNAKPVLLQVAWSGGYKAMNDAKMTSRMYDQSFTKPIEASANVEKTEAEMRQDTAAQKWISQVQGMVKAMGGPSMEKGSLRLKTDTTGFHGPWDQAAILNGFTFMAVKKDVLMSVGLQYLDEKQAEALVAKAMSGL